VVGGTAAGAGNVVSSNAFSGVAIDGANDNFVLGNFVGADASGPFEPEPGLGNGTAGMFILSASGNAMRGNAITSTRGGPGVRIQNATSNTVGGTSSADRNIITGNNGFGIQVEGATASGNQVTGNRIGLNSDQAGGVRITGGAQNNAIGGGALGTGNMISGNSRAGAPGVEISGVGTDGNQVLGNLIGLEPDGTTAMPNAADGLVIGEGASRNVVGGTTSAARNVISGHQADNAVGVRIRVGSNSNDIVGNYVGTDSSGATARPNRDGISIESSNTNTLRGNLVSGNDFRGITISGTAAGRASGNRVEGSMIGTNPAGSLPIPNGSDGVSVDDAAATSSGDPAPVPGT